MVYLLQYQVNMSIKKIEIIKALIKSEKIESVNIEFKNGFSIILNDIEETHILNNPSNIKSFKPNAYPITNFEVGDLVWVISQGNFIWLCDITYDDDDNIQSYGIDWLNGCAGEYYHQDLILIKKNYKQL